MNYIITICLVLVQFVGSCQTIDKNIQLKINSLNDGESLIIPNGVYNDVKLQVKNKKNVKIVAEKPGSVVFMGKSMIEINNSTSINISGFKFSNTTMKATVLLVNSSNVVVEDNYFYQLKGDRYNSAITIKDNSINNIVRRNTFDSLLTMGVRINDNDNVGNEVAFNWFKNTPSVKSAYPESNGNGMESIGIGDGHNWGWSAKAKVHHNYFQNVIGDGSEIICSKSDDNEIFYNFFENSQGGISLRLANFNAVHGNIFLNTTRPIRIFGDSHKIYDNFIQGGEVGVQLPSANTDIGDKRTAAPYFRSKNIVISNNLIQETKEPIVFGANYSSVRNKLSSNIKIENNIIDKNDWIRNMRESQDSFNLNKNEIRKGISLPVWQSYKLVGVSWLK